MQPLSATVLLPTDIRDDLERNEPAPGGIPEPERIEEEADSPDHLATARIDLLEQATVAVESVTDDASALPAIRTLDEVAEKLRPVRERLRELPDPSDRARAELAERSAQLIRRLNARAATIRSYPDLQKAIEGTMRA